MLILDSSEHVIAKKQYGYKHEQSSLTLIETQRPLCALHPKAAIKIPQENNYARGNCFKFDTDGGYCI